MFASKESDSDRSELTKQVTDAQLVKAFPLAEKFELTKLDKVRVLPLPPIKNLFLIKRFFIGKNGKNLRPVHRQSWGRVKKL